MKSAVASPMMSAVSLKTKSLSNCRRPSAYCPGVGTWFKDGDARPPHAQLDDVGIEYTFAVHRVTRDRFRHSEPPAKDPAVYPMPLDAPEP
jgi:hypothetical protein